MCALFCLTVVIHDDDLHDGAMAQAGLVVGVHGQLNEERLIRLPFIIINNLNLDDFLCLSRLKDERASLGDVIRTRLRCTVHRLVPVGIQVS